MIKDSGARVNLGNNQFVQVNGNWYYPNNEGKIVKVNKSLMVTIFTLIKMVSKLKELC